MADNNVEVRVTGSLDPSVAASARVAASELNNLGGSATTSASAMSAALRQAGGDLSKVTPAMLGLASAEAAVTPAATEAAAALTTAGRAAGSSRGSYESLVIVHEALQGRMSRIPGSAMILAQSLTGVSGPALIAGAAVVGLTAGLGYLAVKAVEAAKDLDSIKLGADFAGNTDISKEKIQELVNQLDSLPGVSTKDAEEVVGAFARMRDMTAGELTALTALIGDFADTHSEKITKAKDQVVAALSNETLSWKELQALVPNITQAQVDAIEKTQGLGNTHATAAALIDLLRGSLGKVGTEIDKNNASVTASISNWLSYAFAAEAGIGADQVSAQLLAENTSQREKNTAALKTQAQALRDLPAAKPLKDIPKAKTEVAPESNAARERAEEERTFWQETRAEMLANEVGFWQQAVTATVAGTKDHTEAVRGMLRAEAQLHAAQGEGAIAQMREQNAEITANSALSKSEQVQQEIQAAQILLSTDKLTGDQRIELQRSLAEQIRALHEEESREVQRTAEEESQAVRAALRESESVWRSYTESVRQFNRDAATLAREESREEVETRREAMQEIGAVESQLVRGIISGRQNAGQIAAQLVETLLEKELTADLEYLTQHELVNLGVITSDQATAQEGLLAKLAGWAAEKLGLTTAAVATKAVQAPIATAEAESNAAVAATGAAASQAMIPYVGPELAAAAAVSTFASLQPYVALAAYDVGTPYVPRDMIAMVHQGERIIPAAQNRGGSVAGGSTVNFHYDVGGISAGTPLEFRRVLEDHKDDFVRFFAGLQRDNHIRLN